MDLNSIYYSLVLFASDKAQGDQIFFCNNSRLPIGVELLNQTTGFLYWGLKTDITRRFQLNQSRSRKI